MVGALELRFHRAECGKGQFSAFRHYAFTLIAPNSQHERVCCSDLMLRWCIRHRLLFSARQSPLHSVFLAPRTRWSSSSSAQSTLPRSQVLDGVQPNSLAKYDSLDSSLSHRLDADYELNANEVLPPDPSASHSSLATFLEHARVSKLDTKSTVYKGTYFEYLTQSSLLRLGFSLSRIGKAGDRGVDLYGTWELPSLDFPLRCIVQCKAFQSQGAKLGPAIVRELQGAFAAAPSGWRGENTIGVLVTTRMATKGIRDAVRDSRRPVMWVMLDQDGTVQQLLWNKRAADVGAQGVDVTIRHSGVNAEVILLWKGQVWDAKKIENDTK